MGLNVLLGHSRLGDLVMNNMLHHVAGEELHFTQEFEVKGEKWLVLPLTALHTYSNEGRCRGV